MPDPRPPRRLRLFIALWPDAHVRRALAACRDSTAWPAGAAPVADDKLHLTLHFIGPVSAEAVPALTEALARVPARPVALHIDRGQAWPQGVAVLLPSATPAALAQLHAELGAALQALQLPVERRPLRPHVTLARKAAGVQPAAPASAIDWTAPGHALVQSLPDGRYRVLWHGG